MFKAAMRLVHTQTVYNIDETQTHQFSVLGIKAHITETLTIVTATIHSHTGVCLCKTSIGSQSRGRMMSHLFPEA